MIILPAIDIIDGKPVRLYQGDYNKKKLLQMMYLKQQNLFKIWEQNIYI